MRSATLLLFGVLFCTLVQSHLALRSSNVTLSRRDLRPEEKTARLSADKKEIIQFLNTKNVIKTMYKLLFGEDRDSKATSRQVLNVFVKMLELLKSSFGPRARSSSTSRLRDSVDGAAQASISMLQSYVKSVTTTDGACIQRNICEAAQSATRESPQLGGLIVQLGGYATSYLLQSQRNLSAAKSAEAVRTGRSGADCFKTYKQCTESVNEGIN